MVANVLTSSPKIWHVNKRDFFWHNFLASDQWIWQRCCDADFNSAWAHWPYCLSKHPLKQDFLDIYLTTFSESVTSKIQNLWGSSSYWKCINFHLDFKNAAKDWIDIFKLLSWWAKYFLSVANVLTSSPKNWHVNKRDFFELNFLDSDRWIW